MVRKRGRIIENEWDASSASASPPPQRPPENVQVGFDGAGHDVIGFGTVNLIVEVFGRIFLIQLGQANDADFAGAIHLAPVRGQGAYGVGGQRAQSDPRGFAPRDIQKRGQAAQTQRSHEALPRSAAAGVEFNVAEGLPQRRVGFGWKADRLDRAQRIAHAHQSAQHIHEDQQRRQQQQQQPAQHSSDQLSHDRARAERLVGAQQKWIGNRYGTLAVGIRQTVVVDDDVAQFQVRPHVGAGEDYGMIERRVRTENGTLANDRIGPDLRATLNAAMRSDEYRRRNVGGRMNDHAVADVDVFLGAGAGNELVGPLAVEDRARGL